MRTVRIRISEEFREHEDALVDYDQLSKDLSRPFGGRAQLGDEVASYIRDLIMSGQLVGGESLRLDRLATHLGVSATPVREALMSLRAEGFVDLEPRKGFLVLPLTEQDIKDVFLAQATIAGELAARAVNVIDEAGIKKLRDIQSRIVSAEERGDSPTTELENYLFHREINRLAASPKLSWLLRMVVHYSPRRFYGDIEGWSAESQRDHESLLDAFEQRDAVRASEIMAEHINAAGNFLATFLSEKAKRAEASPPFAESQSPSVGTG